MARAALRCGDWVADSKWRLVLVGRCGFPANWYGRHRGVESMIRRLLNWLRGPSPQQQLTPADLQRLQAAEAKRQRRMERNRESN